MGKPQKKAPAAADAKRSTGFSLDLGPLINKKPRDQSGTAAQLQVRCMLADFPVC